MTRHKKTRHDRVRVRLRVRVMAGVRVGVGVRGENYAAWERHVLLKIGARRSVTKLDTRMKTTTRVQ